VIKADNSVESGAECTAVTAEDLFVNDGDNWQTVEAVGERLPQFDTVASLACKFRTKSLI